MDGTDMNRVIAIVACGFTLAGCSSWGSWMPDSWTPNFDFMPKAAPPPANVQFQSEPAGAEAKTSTGATCKTPCALAMDPDKEFSVTFTLAGYLPQTVPVAVHQPDAGLTPNEGEKPEKNFIPNPVSVELAAAPKAPPKRAPTPPNKPAPKPAAAAAKPPAAKPATAAPAPAAPAARAPAAPSPWPPVQ